MLQGCPNGARRHGVPRTSEQIAADAAAMVDAGAEELHLHPKDADGADTLEPDIVASVVTAVRALLPGIPVGVTTGAWAERNAARRLDLVRAWPADAAPDYASVNWHEPGAREVATALLDAGIGVEAGLYSGTPGAQVLVRSGLAHRMHRVLAEVTETDPVVVRAAAVRHHALTHPLAEKTGRPLLLHGEELGAWPVLQLSAELGADQRIGLEDVLHDPDGRPATNATLVRFARDVIGR